MIIAEDGVYYIISCQKCGTAIRKHKSCCTRYGETYHFNPEFKCPQCGFTAKVVYGSPSASPSPVNAQTKKSKGFGNMKKAQNFSSKTQTCSPKNLIPSSKHQTSPSEEQIPHKRQKELHLWKDHVVKRYKKRLLC